MKLEEIYNNHFNNVTQEIDSFLSLNRELSENITDKDPQFNRMVDALALVGAVLEYDIDVKANKDLRNLLINIHPELFATLPGAGIIKVSLKNHDYLTINKGSLLRTKDYSITTIASHTVQRIEIEDYKYANDSATGNACLSIYFKGKVCKSGMLEVFASSSIINNIFYSSCQIKASIKIRDEYYIPCNISLRSFLSLSQVLAYKEVSGFFLIEGIYLPNGIDSFVVLISAAEEQDLSKALLEVNCVAIENKFKDEFIAYSDKRVESKYNPIIDSNREIISIEEVVDKSSNSMQQISYKNDTGWMLQVEEDSTQIKDLNDYSIYLQASSNSHIAEKIRLRSYCMNRELSNIVEQKLFFDPYIAADIKWIKSISPAKRFMSHIELENTIKYSRLNSSSLTEQIKALNSYITLFAKSKRILSMKITNITEVIKKQVILGHALASVGSCIYINCSYLDHATLYAIFNTLNMNSASFVDLIVEEGERIIKYEA